MFLVVINEVMSIYRELDKMVQELCLKNNINPQSHVGNDMSYYLFFIGDDDDSNVQYVMSILEKFGFERITRDKFNKKTHYYTINLMGKK
jgi:hypothetical protein